MSYKVLVADPISVEGLKSLNDDADFEVIHQTGLSEAELIDTIQDYDALIVRSQTTVTADILKAGQKIKSCCSARVSVSTISIRKLRQKKVLSSLMHLMAIRFLLQNILSL